MPKVRQEDVSAEYEALNRRPPNREYVKNLGILYSLDTLAASLARQTVLDSDKQMRKNFFMCVLELQHRYEIGKKRPHMGLLTPYIDKVAELLQDLTFFLTSPSNTYPGRFRWVGRDLINLDQTTLITFDGRKRQMWKPPILSQEFTEFMEWRIAHESDVLWHPSDIPDSLVEEEAPNNVRVTLPSTNRSFGPIQPPSKGWPSVNIPPPPFMPSTRNMLSILRSTSTQSAIGGQSNQFSGLQTKSDDLINSPNDSGPQGNGPPSRRRKRRGMGEKKELDSYVQKLPSSVQNMHQTTSPPPRNTNTLILGRRAELGQRVPQTSGGQSSGSTDQTSSTNSTWNSGNPPKRPRYPTQNGRPRSSAEQLGHPPGEPILTRGVSNLSSIGPLAAPFLPTSSTSNKSYHPMQPPSNSGNEGISQALPYTVHTDQYGRRQYVTSVVGVGQYYGGYAAGVSDSPMYGYASTQQSIATNAHQTSSILKSIPSVGLQHIQPQGDANQYQIPQELRQLYQQRTRQDTLPPNQNVVDVQPQMTQSQRMDWEVQQMLQLQQQLAQQTLQQSVLPQVYSVQQQMHMPRQQMAQGQQQLVQNQMAQQLLLQHQMVQQQMTAQQAAHKQQMPQHQRNQGMATVPQPHQQTAQAQMGHPQAVQQLHQQEPPRVGDNQQQGELPDWWNLYE
ncbi:hypothetical protein BKA65DRAFT_479370 [Rhexocercosporidium sp. MPI-PUGE-AT-0058]|nr:hypothetical protein BKA65DRAFT_479370 [Rhexocercosporidium sp. MPI-PUGE-AT-0058]